MEKLLLTDKEVGVALGVSKQTVWQYLKKGIIPKPIKFGNTTRWKYSEIVEMVEVML